MPTTPLISTNFTTSTATKKYIFTDITDWVGMGIALTSVNGNLNITSPSGIEVYNNNADINDPSLYTDALSDIFNQNSVRTNRAVATPNILLPIDPLTGVAELGQYTILYNVYDSVATTFYTQTFIYDNRYIRPKGVINPYVNVLSGLVRMTDGTDYTSGGVNPSPSPISAAFRMQPPNFTNGTTPSPITATFTTIGGVMTLGYPNVIIGVTQSSIASTLTYTFTDGLIITDLINVGLPIDVQAADFCSIICGLKNLQARAFACCKSGTWNPDLLTYVTVCSLMTEVNNQVNCGVDVDITAVVAMIKTLVPCNDGCHDCGDTGSIVIPVGSILNNVIVNAANSTVTVTTVIAGTTTTYSVAVSAATMALINNATANIVTLFASVALLNTEIAPLLAESVNVVSLDNSLKVDSIANSVGVVLVNGGFGYTAGDTLTENGGGAPTPLTIKVDTVDGSGTILTCHQLAAGSYLNAIPSQPFGVTGGTGLTATFNGYYTAVFSVETSNKNAYAKCASIDISAVATHNVFSTGATAPAAGNYYVWFEADLLLGFGDSTISGSYYPIKNGATSVNINASLQARAFDPPVSAAHTATYTKLVMICPVVLAAGDVVSIGLVTASASGGGLMEIDTGEIVLIKMI